MFTELTEVNKHVFQILFWDAHALIFDFDRKFDVAFDGITMTSVGVEDFLLTLIVIFRHHLLFIEFLDLKKYGSYNNFLTFFCEFNRIW